MPGAAAWRMLGSWTSWLGRVRETTASRSYLASSRPRCWRRHSTSWSCASPARLASMTVPIRGGAASQTTTSLASTAFRSPVWSSACWRPAPVWSGRLRRCWASRTCGCPPPRAWAKYTGAADYDQVLHRDYLNHTVLVPARTSEHQQLELFVYLLDVPDNLSQPHFRRPRPHCGSPRPAELVPHRPMGRTVRVAGSRRPGASSCTGRRDRRERSSPSHPDLPPGHGDEPPARRPVNDAPLLPASGRGVGGSARGGPTQPRPGVVALRAPGTPRQLALFGFPPPGLHRDTRSGSPARWQRWHGDGGVACLDRLADVSRLAGQGSLPA